MIDFAEAIRRAERDAGGKGIGTLGEKTLHLALKYYFAPDPLTHEQPLGGFVADAVTEDGVVEIQTRGLARLKPKITAFLPLCPVTVVHPVIAEKQLVRVDENGEILAQRKSPKHESVFTAMRELYMLRDFVLHPNFRAVLTELELTEYSVQTGSRRRTKLDRVPTALRQLWVLESPADFAALLPPMPETFTAAECAKLLGISADTARAMLNLYAKMGLMQGDGKRPQNWHKIGEI